MSAMFFGKKDRDDHPASRIDRLNEQLLKNPGSFHLQIKLAEAYIQNGDSGRGISLLMKMAEKDARGGAVDKAIAVYKLILRYDSDNIAIRDILANLYSYKGLTAEAAALGELSHGDEQELREEINLLPQISLDDLEQLGKVFTTSQIKAGDDIIRQGDVGDVFYIIVEGQVGVVLCKKDRQENEVVQLGPGNFFGEMSILGEGSRMATVRALTDCHLLTIPQEQFEMIERQFPQLQQLIVDGYHKRMIDVVLSSLMFFHRFPDNRRSEIISRLEIMPVTRGDCLIEEGQQNQTLYIILSGEMQVQMQAGDQCIKLAKLGKGNFFGEISVITGRPAIATVIACTDGLLACMDRKLLDEIATQLPHFLRKVMDRLKKRNQQTMSRMIE
ncbi:MAG: cyclic nucleotide-binding domain-containing protein, partial [Deltaproteobacteria bacterium]|nr:cyclic nucleotide-binding domain-containing protein [Deltaproteobacteria bacterium]